MIECPHCKQMFANNNAYQIHLGIGAPAFHSCNSKEQMIVKGMSANADKVWSIPDRLVTHANGWAHLDTKELALEADLLEAVAEYTYDRHASLTRSQVVGFDREDLERVLTENGRLVFTVEDVHVTEKLEQDGHPVWYVSSTLMFQVRDDGDPIEGSTDIYECTRSDKEWCIEWYGE